MGFVDQKPMRASGAAAQLRDLRQQLGEECRPIRYGQTLRIDDDISLCLSQQLEPLIDIRWCLAVADRHRILKFVIVTLRIEHAKLEASLRHALGQCGGQR